MNSLELKASIRTCFNKLQTEQKINNFPLSAYFIKSLVRGDFIVGKSDIDILLIFQNEVTHKEQAVFAEKLSSIVKDSLKNNPEVFGHCHDCDILYLCENEIPKTENDFLNSPFSIFTAFGFDLEASHELIVGKDILKSFISLDPTLFVDVQITRLLEKSQKGNQDVILVSGQTVRLLLIKHGLRSLHKKEIRKFLESNVDIESWLRDFAIRHFQYCYEDEENKLDFENECREFLNEVVSAKNKISALFK